MFLILSKNSPVVGISVTFKILPIIPRKDFLVNTSLIYPAFAGTTSLNNTLPTVVLIIFRTCCPFLSTSKVLTLIPAFKSTFSSLKAMFTSSGE